MLTMIYAVLIQFSPAAIASEGNDKVHLVVQDIESRDFFLQSAPLIGCFGSPQSPRLAQWTAAYAVPTNIGCGDGAIALSNINVLTCAKVVAALPDKNQSSYREITLDVRGCAARDDRRFLQTVERSAELNFPQKSPYKKIKLNLVRR